MARVALRPTGRTHRRVRRGRAPGSRESGQVLIDALIATALIVIALPILTETARTLAQRAQQRHREVCAAIEAENALAFGRPPHGEE